MQIESDELLTVSLAAVMLAVKRETILHHIYEQHLKHIRVGGIYLTTIPWLLEFQSRQPAKRGPKQKVKELTYIKADE